MSNTVVLFFFLNNISLVELHGYLIFSQNILKPLVLDIFCKLFYFLEHRVHVSLLLSVTLNKSNVIIVLVFLTVDSAE